MGASASNDLAGSLEEDRRFTSDALSRVLFDDAALFKLASELKGPRVADPKESGDQSTILASCHFLAACLLLALSFLCLALRTVSDAKAHICYSEQPRYSLYCCYALREYCLYLWRCDVDHSVTS